MHFLKKFLAPMALAKKESLFLFSRSVRWGLQGVLYASCMKFVIDSLQASNWETAKKYIIFMGVISVISIVYMFVSRLVSIHLRNKMINSLYNTYLAKFITSDNNKTEVLWTWKTNNIITRGIDHWVQRLIDINWSLFEIIIGIIVAFVAIIMQVWLLWWLGAAILFMISVIINQIGNKSVAGVRMQRRDVFTQIDRNVVKVIMAKLEVLQNKKTEYELSKFDALFWQTKALTLKEQYKRIWSLDLQQISFTVIQIWLLFVMGRWVYNGKYTIGTISMVWMLINQINGRIRMINDFMTNYYQSIVYIEKLWDTFDGMPDILWYDQWQQFAYKQGDIVFEDVSYKYDESEVVKNLHLHISWQKKTAFVWVSGSWKSTLIKLIWWYIHPTHGRILVDWQQLPAAHDALTEQHETVSLKSYYPHIGYLTQEPNVFDWTVRENLLYWAQWMDISQEEIEKTLLLAQCHFVFDLKDWLDTEIWERWVRLSWGQRQRLAIAKIMLKDPSIVLLDEPTSALDSFSEEEVTKALNALFIGRTVVIIAHRLQTVKKADEIIVLEDGHVQERGSHDELVKAKWKYAKMLELQSGF